MQTLRKTLIVEESFSNAAVPSSDNSAMLAVPTDEGTVLLTPWPGFAVSNITVRLTAETLEALLELLETGKAS